MGTTAISFRKGRSEPIVSSDNPLPVTDAGAEPTAAEALAAAVAPDLSTQILVELRVISRLLAAGLNVDEDIEAIRSDESAGVGA